MATLENNSAGFEPSEVQAKDTAKQADAYFALSVRLADGTTPALQDQKARQYNLISLHADAMNGMIGKLIEKLDAMPNDAARVDWLARNIVVNYRKPVSKKAVTLDMFGD